eukprot:TRINITY_DN28320_c0_g1_i2.p1 TRINITY_DN28320_c0_g1~~TRINITY_DN28320_c0_g1_i2.p1  ORF type:complete len:119 (-),score=58.02 TRINITY_DN28320_c0_g1_i2:98-454(-)
MIRRPPRSTQSRSSAASDVYKRQPHNCPISALDNWNLDGLLETIWDHLNFIRVYTKPRGQVPDYGAPVILKKTPVPSLENFCTRIHRQFMKKFKYAWVWGRGAPYLSLIHISEPTRPY